jgi:hypothetical protein
MPPADSAASFPIRYQSCWFESDDSVSGSGFLAGALALRFLTLGLLAFRLLAAAGLLSAFAAAIAIYFYSILTLIAVHPGAICIALALFLLHALAIGCGGWGLKDRQRGCGGSDDDPLSG